MRWNWWIRCVLVSAIALGTGKALADGAPREPRFIVGQSATVRAGEDVEAAIVIGGDLNVEGRVRGLAAAIGGDVRVAPQAVVDGPVASIGGALFVDDAARVMGPKVQVAGGDFGAVATELSEMRERPRPSFWIGPAVRVTQILAVFVVALFLVSWAPQRVQAVREAVTRQPARDTLVGLGIILGFVPFCLLLGFSIVGLPLIPAALFFVLATFILGLTAIASAIGRKLAMVRDASNLRGAMASGMLVLAAVAAVPFLGGLALFMACVYGAGAVLSTRFGARPPGPPAGVARPSQSSPTDVPATAQGT